MGKLTNKIRRSIATKLSLGIVLMAIPVFVICVGLLFVLSLYNLKKETDGRAASTLKTMELRITQSLFHEYGGNSHKFF